MARGRELAGSPLTLKANHWRIVTRLQRAASVPFQSMHMGRKDMDGTSIGKLQQALKIIERESDRFPDRLLPHAGGPSAPPGIKWGPFDFFFEDGEDPGTVGPVFAGNTDLSVRIFQKQANVESDGKAGMETLAKMDELLVFLGSRGELGP